MMAMTRFRRLVPARSLITGALLAVLVVQGARAQDLATVRVEENLRAEPQGVVLGRLAVGSSFPVLEARGQWVQVEVQGWIWTRSVRTTDRMGFDLAVAVDPEENLRAEPSGAIVARLLAGALLEGVGSSVPGWTEVRRAAWVWAPSLTLAAAPAPASAPTASAGQEEGAEMEWWRTGPEGAPVLSGPDGDTLARTHPGAELRVLAREGNWVRVRLEGWSWAPGGEQSDSSLSTSPSGLTLQQVAREPEAHRGRVVSWELQFVSLERAERIRTDFFEGEPFLLARAAPPEGSFVYVVIPPERMGEVEGLIPLERVRIVGRIRTGAAALTGNPILELLELTRLREDG